MRFLWRVLPLGFLFLCFNAVGQENARVSSVRFAGNHSFGRRDLMQVIQLKPVSMVSRLFLKKRINYFYQPLYNDDFLNIVRFYHYEGFPDVQVFPQDLKLSGNGKKAHLGYHVIEGAPYFFGNVSYRSDSALSAWHHLSSLQKRRLSYRIQSKRGARFREEAIHNDRQLLIDMIDGAGYPYAEVIPVVYPDTVHRSATLEWQIDRKHPAFFGSVIIQGDSGVSYRRIMRQLNFATGDAWSQKRLTTTQADIYSLGVFRVVTVKAIWGSSLPDTVPVIVYLKESPQWSTRFGVGYGHEDRLRAFAEVQLLRFPGGLSRVQLNGKYSYVEPLNVSLKYYEPAFPFKNTTLMASPYLMMQNEIAYNLRRYGGELGLLGRWGQQLNGNITFYSEAVRVIRQENATDINVKPMKESYDKSGVSAGLLYSTLTPQLDPDAGILISGNGKWNTALFGGRFPFVRLLGKVVYAYPASKSMVLAMKLQGGTVKSVGKGDFIPVEERFYGGGSASVRGWSRQGLGPHNDAGKPIGGLSMVEFSIEPRIRIFNPVYLVPLLDGGNVWTDAFAFRIEDLHFSAGLGIRVKTPIGPVGIDVARPVFEQSGRWRLFLNIGNPF